MRKKEPTILSIAAQLLTQQISDNPEDYPKKFPKWVLKYIEAHNRRQQDWAMELRSIHDKTTQPLKKIEAKDE